MRGERSGLESPNFAENTDADNIMKRRSFSRQLTNSQTTGLARSGLEPIEREIGKTVHSSDALPS